MAREFTRPPRPWRFALALLLGPPLALNACGKSEPPPRPPLERAGSVAGRALLVGVQEYASAEIKDLAGPRGDVAAMRVLLIERFGFAPERVRTLLDAAATRDAILAALQEEVLALREGEVLVLHFSGHGSQVEDLDGDEEDGLDETFVPHDARIGPRPDVSDDDLKAALGHPARVKGSEVVVLLDSCHSGTGTRDGLLVRGIDAPRGTPSAKPAPLAPGLVRTLEIEPDHVQLAAASADQLALEAKIDGEPRGLFTHALVSALARADPSVSLVELVNGPVQAELLTLCALLRLSNVPNPQLEAPRASLDRPLFWPLERARPRLFSACARADGAGFARVEEAAALGLVPGAVVAFYPPAELEFGPAARLGRVVALEGGAARIELAGAELTAGSRAVRRLAAPALPLSLTSDDDELGARTIEELAQRIGASALGRGGSAVFEARRAGDGVLLTRADDLELAKISGATTAELARGLADALARVAVAESLFALRNPESPLALEARLATQLALPDPATRARGVEWRPDLALPHFAVSAASAPATLTNAYRLDLCARGPVFVTVLELDAEGKLARLFPDAHSESLGVLRRGLVSGADWLRLPDPREPRAEAGTELLHWRVAPPAGPSLLVVFASPDEELVERLRASFPSGDAVLPLRAVEALTELRAGLEREPSLDFDCATIGAWIDG